MNEIQLTNFMNHLRKLHQTVYAEPDADYHERLTRVAFDKYIVPNRNRIFYALDAGCGNGLALQLFRENGIDSVGITMDEKEYQECTEKGFKVRLEDMNFTNFGDGIFDLIWARHSLEHSPMPMITIMEFYRMLKKSGYLYVEVPQDDSIHIDNPNHFSVLSDRHWQSLFRKGGFELLDRSQFMVNFDNWTDIFWCYWLQKQ